MRTRQANNGWYVEADGKAKGPFPERVLLAWIRNGTIYQDTYVSLDGKIFSPAGDLFDQSLFIEEVFPEEAQASHDATAEQFSAQGSSPVAPARKKGMTRKPRGSAGSLMENNRMPTKVPETLGAAGKVPCGYCCQDVVPMRASDGSWMCPACFRKVEGFALDSTQQLQGPRGRAPSGELVLELPGAESVVAPPTPRAFADSGAGIVERYHSGGFKHGDPNTVTCPHCWTVFPLEDALYIAKHPDLVGDALLGNDAAQRFKPSRFTANGQAVDPGGMSSGEIACPNCHLEVPRSLAEVKPIFFSIVGAPGSGKSYYLGTMTWCLRQTLMEYFGFALTDAETTMNAILNQYEESLFMNSKPDEFFAPGDLVRKTEKGADLYSRVDFFGQPTTFTKPFVFNLTALEHNPFAASEAKNARAVILYDNAGEHFLPGEDTSLEPTPHLSRSQGLFFIFDPTKDARLRRKLGGSTFPVDGTLKLERQDIFLNELARRVRKQLALSQRQKTSQSLIVILSKFDVWGHLLKLNLIPDPYLNSLKYAVSGLNVRHIEDVSFSLRHLLLQTCPELVAAAETFSNEVTYIPVSAMGTPPEIHDGQWFVRPQDIDPIWISVPFLFALYKLGLLLGGKHKIKDAVPATIVNQSGGTLFCSTGKGAVLQVPARYTGHKLHHPETGQVFVVPTIK